MIHDAAMYADSWYGGRWYETMHNFTAHLFAGNILLLSYLPAVKLIIHAIIEKNCSTIYIYRLKRKMNLFSIYLL